MITSRSRFGLPSLFAVNASVLCPGRRPFRRSGTAICVVAPHAGAAAGTDGSGMVADAGVAFRVVTVPGVHPARGCATSERQ